MKLDYDDMENCLTELKSELKKLNVILDNIETSFNTIVNTSNWSSQTRDFYTKSEKQVSSNIDINYNKQSNTIAYLENVISNYNATEDKLTSIFSGFKI